MKKFLTVVFAVVAAAGFVTQAAAQVKAKPKRADKGLAHQALRHVLKPAVKYGVATAKLAKKVLY